MLPIPSNISSGPPAILPIGTPLAESKDSSGCRKPKLSNPFSILIANSLLPSSTVSAEKLCIPGGLGEIAIPVVVFVKELLPSSAGDTSITAVYILLGSLCVWSSMSSAT